jgi:RIO-like serine/threonine protein kinase
MFESIKLSDIPNQKCGVLRSPSSTRPTLWLIEENGLRAVVKDFSLNGFLYRNIIGRFLIWREGKAYRRLEGLKGVPTLYRTIDGLALVMQEISGKDLEALERKTRLSDSFFRDLRALVEGVHKHGLAHCDLKRAPNILLGHDGKPYIVDWSASIAKRAFNFYPLNLIYQRFIQDDLNAIVKAKIKYCPDSISPEEKRQYTRRSKTENLIRAIRNKARHILQRIA